MATAKGLTSEQNDRVRGFLRELLLRHGNSQTELAPKLGVSQPAISAILSERQGTSYTVACRIAELLGLDEAEVIHGRPPVAKADRRLHAAELAREDGVLEAAIQAVLAEEVGTNNAHWSTLKWAMRMKGRALEMLDGNVALARPPADV